MAPVMVGAIKEEGGMKRMAVRSDGLIDQTEPFITEQETSELLFFQLPRTFPTLSVPPRAKDVLRDAPAGVQHPEGKVGRMVVYRSGRVTMELGNVPFDVTPAAEAEFYQTITTVNAETKHAYVLGQVKKRYVCSPDVDALLQQEMPEEAAEDVVAESKDDLMDEGILEVTEAGPSGFHLSSDDDDVEMVITR
ncbi:RNA polymerase III RPC4-domain-containing protein [Cladochytrium replicatum]|nr:RNA polymerase III RPC4-domain-containing protein [Cladochytrium replicatum]